MNSPAGAALIAVYRRRFNRRTTGNYNRFSERGPPPSHKNVTVEERFLSVIPWISNGMH